MKYFFLLTSLVLLSNTPALDFNKLSLDSVPEVEHKGKIVHAWSWKELNQDNIIIATRVFYPIPTEWVDSTTNCQNTPEKCQFPGDLHVYQYKRDGLQWQRVWHLKEFNESYFKRFNLDYNDVFIQDLDKDGSMEVGFFYSYDEDSFDDFNALTFKFMLYRNGLKLPVRGNIPGSTNKNVKIEGGQTISVSEKVVDPEPWFTNAIPGTEFSKVHSMFKKFCTDKWKEKVKTYFAKN